MKDAQAIFRRYEEIRPRLPRATIGGQAQKIGSLLDLAGEVDAFVFDAFGVLNIGETPIPGADRRVRDLRAAGCQIRVLTNAASYDKSGAIAKFERLGFELDPSEIITSRDATLPELDDRHWGVFAAGDDRLADLPDRVTRLDCRAADYDAVDGFLFLSTAGWTEPRQSLLETSLARSARPLIVANADLVAPRGQTFSLEPGFYGHQVADRTGIEVRFLGKPFPEVYTLAQSTLGDIARDRIVMCGDTLHTDILGAAAFGWQSVLVTRDGLFAGTDVDAFVTASRIHATWQLGRI